MNFSDFVCFEAVVPELESVERNDVITELVDALNDAGELKKGTKEDIKKAVIKRENEASTGMGKGVAIPHVKHPKVDKVMAAVGRSTKGIDFSALDKQPVFSVFLLLSPQGEADQHLQAMELIFKHLQQNKFRKFLKQLDTKEKIIDLLKEADETSFIEQ